MSIDPEDLASAGTPSANLGPKVSNSSEHTVLPVFLATFGAFSLSIVNASVFAVLIGLGMIFSGLVDVGDAQNLEEKMKAIGEIKTLNVAAGVLGTSSALLLVGLVLIARPRNHIVRRLRLYRPKFTDVILISLGMLGLTTALSVVINILGLDQTGSLAEFHRMFQAWSFEEKMAMLPVLALCPGIAEEVFFRGYALTKIELAQGFKSAAIVTAVLFGLIHLDPIHSIAAALMGIYLAYAIRLSGSLWTTIIAHTVNNAMAVLFPDLFADNLGVQVLALILGLLTCGVALFVLYRQTDEPHAAQW